MVYEFARVKKLHWENKAEYRAQPPSLALLTCMPLSCILFTDLKHVEGRSSVMTSLETLFFQLFTHFFKSTKTYYSLRTLQLTCTMAVLTFPPATLRKGFSSSTSSPTLDIGFRDDSHSDWGELVSQSNFPYKSLMPRDTGHFRK